jgi:hypothetical protein
MWPTWPDFSCEPLPVRLPLILPVLLISAPFQPHPPDVFGVLARNFVLCLTDLTDSAVSPFTSRILCNIPLMNLTIKSGTAVTPREFTRHQTAQKKLFVADLK